MAPRNSKSHFNINKTNNYIEYYETNGYLLRRWYLRNNMWYEYYPDYNSSTLGKMIKTGRFNSKPLKPIKYYYYNEYGQQLYY